MRILVVSGYEPNNNSSANLSHNAFIEGFIKLGYKVDVLCHCFDIDNKNNNFDYPQFNEIYMYDGLSIYEKISKNRSGGSLSLSSIDDVKSNKAKPKAIEYLTKFLKKKIWSLYGPYNPSVIWYYRTKKFKSDVYYDYVISMAYPQISHRVVAYLITKKRLKTKKWIQLWEDPWYNSLELKAKNSRVKKAELKLINVAWDIVYVSPITLQKQQSIFNSNKEKMRWCPLASYYQSNLVSYRFQNNHYGYFGDYYPDIRNLKPFYDVAIKKKINTVICGSPSDMFVSTDNISIYPRLSTVELKTYEDNVNVVVCLFNLGGGQIPGKIYQLAATNKVILAILDGPDDEQKIIRNYFDKFKRFIFCQNTEKSISEAIDMIENGALDSTLYTSIDDFSVEKSARRLLGE